MGGVELLKLEYVSRSRASWRRRSPCLRPRSREGDARLEMGTVPFLLYHLLCFKSTFYLLLLSSMFPNLELDNFPFFFFFFFFLDVPLSLT